MNKCKVEQNKGEIFLHQCCTPTYIYMHFRNAVIIYRSLYKVLQMCTFEQEIPVLDQFFILQQAGLSYLRVKLKAWIPKQAARFTVGVL